MSGTGAGNVEDRLTEEIDVARACCDKFVIIESLPYFVQLMPNHDTLYGEVISNRYLEGADRLTPKQQKRLVDLGWGTPGAACHSSCSSTLHPNYTMIWPSTTPSDHIARDLLRGLLVAMAGVGEGAQPFVIKSRPRATEPSTGTVPRH
jgi:hypothetical protein